MTCFYLKENAVLQEGWPAEHIKAFIGTSAVKFFFILVIKS